MPLRTLGVRGREFLSSYWTPAGKRALGNLVGLIGCTGLSQVCGLGVTLLLSHGLSGEGFAAVVFALTLQAYLFTFGTFGMTHVVVRDLALHPEKATETVSAYLTIVGVSSVAVGVVTVIAAAALPASADERLMLWCVAAGNVAVCLNCNPLFDAAHRQALAAAVALPADVFVFVAVGTLYVRGELTVPLVALLYSARYLGTALLLAVVHRRLNPNRRWSFRWPRVRSMTASGWPILLAGLLYLVPTAGGVVLLKAVAGAAAAAEYGLASQLAGGVLMVFSLYARVVYPHIHGGHGLTKSFVGKLAAATTVVVGLLVVAAAGGGLLVFDHLIGAAYARAYPAFLLLLLANGLACGGMILSGYLIRQNRKWWLQAVNLFSAAVFLAAAWAGEPSPTWFAASVVLAYVFGCSLTAGVIGSSRPAVTPATGSVGLRPPPAADGEAGLTEFPLTPGVR